MTSTPLSKLTISLITLALLVSAGFAQGGERPMGSTRVENLFLLKFPNIQKEMGMSKAQIDQMEKAYQVYRSAAEPIIKRIESSGKPPTRADENAMANHTNIFETRLMQILNANQRRRLRELSIQAGGTAMLLHPEISKQLKLTPQQISRLETGIRNAVGRIQKVEENAARQAGLTNEAEVRKLSEKELKARVDRAGRIAKPQVDKIRTETRRQLLAILNQSQRQQWTNMQGKPFID
ncbi:MAG: hypothetical protein ACK4P3_09260 [Fimbriimonadaceae bacterium]